MIRDQKCLADHLARIAKAIDLQIEDTDKVALPSNYVLPNALIPNFEIIGEARAVSSGKAIRSTASL